MTAATPQATILVVDDDYSSRDIASRLLRLEGYTVVGADSGEACLRTIKTQPIDLILLDIMMPGMGGFDVCTALHDMGSRIPIILLTAKDDTDTRLEGMHHGVSEFLTKPINKVELYARVRAQLHILELGRQLETVERNLHALRRDPDPTPRSKP